MNVRQTVNNLNLHVPIFFLGDIAKQISRDQSRIKAKPIQSPEERLKFKLYRILLLHGFVLFFFLFFFSFSRWKWQILESVNQCQPRLHSYAMACFLHQFDVLLSKCWNIQNHSKNKNIFQITEKKNFINSNDYKAKKKKTVKMSEATFML